MNLINCLESSKCIDDNRWEKKTSPSIRSSKNLWGEQIRVSVFDVANENNSNTPKDKFQDQLTLIQ